MQRRIAHLKWAPPKKKKKLGPIHEVVIRQRREERKDLKDKTAKILRGAFKTIDDFG